MNEFLIDGLWILEIESGSCLFEENYKKWSVQDTQLISSFLTAIRSFTKEAFSEDIEFIQFKTRKIIFEISNCQQSQGLRFQNQMVIREYHIYTMNYNSQNILKGFG